MNNRLLKDLKVFVKVFFSCLSSHQHLSDVFSKTLMFKITSRSKSRGRKDREHSNVCDEG